MVAPPQPMASSPAFPRHAVSLGSLGRLSSAEIERLAAVVAAPPPRRPLSGRSLPTSAKHLGAALDAAAMYDDPNQRIDSHDEDEVQHDDADEEVAAGGHVAEETTTAGSCRINANLRTLDARYAIALEALQQYRQKWSTAVPHEPPYECKLLSRRRRPLTASSAVTRSRSRPQSGVSTTTQRPLSSPSAAATSRGYRGVESAGEFAPTIVGTSLNHVVTGQPPAAAVDGGAGLRAPVGSTRPRSAPTATTGTSGGDAATSSSTTHARPAVRGMSAGRSTTRPLSSKAPKAVVSVNAQRIVNHVMAQMEKQIEKDEEDAAAGIVDDDDGEEDAELEGIVHRAQQQHQRSSRPSTATMSAAARPRSAKVSTGDDEEREKDAPGAHAKGTADIAHVRGDIPTPVYFSTFQHGSITDFLQSQKVATFGVYKERLDDYLRAKGRAMVLPSSAAGGGSAHTAPSASSSGTLPSTAVFLQSVASAAAALQTRQYSTSTATHCFSLGKGTNATASRTSFSPPKRSAHKIAEDNVEEAFAKRPTAHLKAAAIQRW